MSLSYLSSIKEVFSNDGAFCALKLDGTIKCWGNTEYGGTTPPDISNVKNIYTSNQTFTVLTKDNTLITWGKTSHGGGTIKISKNMKKQSLLNRMYGEATSIHNVKKNNLRLKKNFNFNNSSYNRPIQQLLSPTDETFIENNSVDKLETINNIKKVTNGEINIPDINIKTNKERHNLIDKLFSNITDVSFNIASSKIMSKSITKENTKVFKTNQTINAKSTNNSDISTNQAIYGNLSDLSDNITLTMDNNVSFKVTRTTNNSVNGKYIIEVLSGKMIIYGRHSGILEHGTASLQLGEYQDDDNIIINSHSFFFGGFGCNGLTNTADNSKKYQNIVTTEYAAAYLDNNGKVFCFGEGEYDTLGLDLDSGVIKICATRYNFIALKDNGKVIIWGKLDNEDFISKKKLHVKHYVNNTVNTLKYDYSVHTNDIIDIFTIAYKKSLVVLKKKNNSFILFGEGIVDDISKEAYLDKDGKLPINGVVFENINQLYICSSDENHTNNNHMVGINNKGKIVSIGETVTYNTSTYIYGTENNLNTSGLNINDKYYGISGEILTTGIAQNYNGNFYQNYTTENLPPVSKIYINGSFVTAILNDGTAAWWGKTYVYGPRSAPYEKDDNDIVTTSVFDKLKSNVFIDGISSISSTALLDLSGGVILFGIKKNSEENPTDIFVDVTNNLKNDISANIIKMAASKYNSYVFLRNDNVAILVPNVDMDISNNLFPNSYISSITQKGSSYKKTYLIPNIQDIYMGGAGGFGFITTSNNVILWSHRTDYAMLDIGETVGGELENIKELFSNGNSWCALKYDNTLITIKGGQESSNNKIGYYEIMAMVGCDYNDIYFGINGIYSNGGNGNGGCVLNGDGSETTLNNVKNIFPVKDSVDNDWDIRSSTQLIYGGGYIAILDNGVKETIVYWGNTQLSYQYYSNNVQLNSNVKDEGLSLLDISNTLIDKTSSSKIFGIKANDHFSSWESSHLMKNNKYKYPNEYNYNGNIVITVKVENVGGNDKFVLNGDASGYTFKEGYSYILDTSDITNKNFKISISNSSQMLKNENCVQYLTPGEPNSFLRYYKATAYSYIYCETNGILMGSLYNSSVEPTEFSTLSSVFGSNVEKNIISKYVIVPENKLLLDASFNNISINNDAKCTAVLQSLFSTLSTNYLIVYKNKIGFKSNKIGLSSPLTNGYNMKIINTTNISRGISISGETINSGAVAVSDVGENDSYFFFMADLSDNILLNVGDKIGAPYYSINSDLPTFVKGVEFKVTRITNSSSTANYDISLNFGTLTVNTDSSTFNTANNTGYFVENDKMIINNIEFNFFANGIISKGSLEKDYILITVTVNSDSKFLFNNSTIKPLIDADKYYKFDVSHNSNNGYKLTFSNSNTTNSYNTILFGTPGTAGAFVEFTPGNLATQQIYIYDGENNDLDMGSLYNPIYINNNISNTNLTSIASQNIENVVSIPNTLYNNLVGNNDFEKNTEKALRRHQMIRTVFLSNPKYTDFTATKTDLGFSDNYDKTQYKVFKPSLDTNIANINISNDTTDNKGFYSGLEDGQTANITLPDGLTVLKVERTSSDISNNGIYYVSNLTNSSDLFLTEAISSTFIFGSNPVGPFMDGDSATINYMPLVFGGIGDGRKTNSTLNPNVPVITPVFNNALKIPIISALSDNTTSGGFCGIASDGKLYKWGISTINYLPPGDDDGNSASSDRITDVSFCVAAGYNILYCKTNGSIGNTAANGEFPLNNSNNLWYDNGSLSNDLSSINDVKEIYACSSSSAVFLRNDGSVGFYGNDGYSAQTTTEKNDFSLRGIYGKQLMDSTDISFSKIKKIVTGPNTIFMLREDGKVAMLCLSVTSNIRDKSIKWNGPSDAIDSTNCILSSCLENSGSFKNYIGNVVDIGVCGSDENDGKYYILNDIGQFMLLVEVKQDEGNLKKKLSPHYSISYDTSSNYFKKTIKVFTFRNNYLQVTEDYSALVTNKQWV